MTDIKARYIIDVNETGMEFVPANQWHGKAHKGEKMRKVGFYSKTSKVNILFEISGDPDNLHRWYEI